MISKDLFIKALEIAHTADVSSMCDCVVLYSVSYQATTINKQKAFDYMQKNQLAMMIDDTICGKQLIAMGLEWQNLQSDADRQKGALIWQIASKRFIANACGNITAFVENADKKSTFIVTELPEILNNPQIKTINAQDKFSFALQFC